MFDIGNALHCVSLKALLSYGLQCFSVGQRRQQTTQRTVNKHRQQTTKKEKKTHIVV